MTEGTPPNEICAKCWCAKDRVIHSPGHSCTFEPSGRFIDRSAPSKVVVSDEARERAAKILFCVEGCPAAIPGGEQRPHNEVCIDRRRFQVDAVLAALQPEEIEIKVRDFPPIPPEPADPGRYAELVARLRGAEKLLYTATIEYDATDVTRDTKELLFRAADAIEELTNRTKTKGTTK